MKWLLLFPLLAALVLGCTAQITVDAATSTSGSSVSSLTFSHTVASGSNQVMLVEFAATNCSSFGNTTPTGVTYGGVALTLKSSYVETGCGTRSSLWYLLAPAVGTANVVITWTGSNTQVAAGANVYSGVDQTSTFDTAAGAGGNFNFTPLTITTHTSANNEMLVDTFAAAASWSAWGSGQTNNWHVNNGGSSYKLTTSAGSYTMSVTLSGNNYAVYGVVALRPVGAVNVTTGTVARHHGGTICCQ